MRETARERETVLHEQPHHVAPSVPARNQQRIPPLAAGNVRTRPVDPRPRGQQQPENVGVAVLRGHEEEVRAARPWREVRAMLDQEPDHVCASVPHGAAQHHFPVR